MTLFTRIAKRRFALANLARARVALAGLARQWLAAFTAELRGTGEPAQTLRWQRFIARTIFLIQGYERMMV